MAATNSFENKVLTHLFTNTAVSGLGDAAGVLPSAAAGNLYVGILTALTDAEIPTATEAAYGAYARVAVCRSAAWTVTANVASNTAAVTFPAATSGSACANFFGIYDSATAGCMLLNGAITTPLAISTGITPEFAAGTLSISLD